MAFDLWNSEDDSPLKGKKNGNKKQLNLFDETSDSADDASMNYKNLYVEERKKRMELEKMVAILKAEIFSLTNGKSAAVDSHNNAYEAPKPKPSILVLDNDDNNDSDDSGKLKQSEWEKLAMEEKERKQKLKLAKSKARAPTAKRLAAASKFQEKNEDKEKFEATSDANIPVVSEQAKANVKESEMGKVAKAVEAVAGEGNMKPIAEEPSAVSQNYRWESDSEPSDVDRAAKTSVSEEKQVEEMTVVEVKDPNQAHWEELAALNRERKAQSRRRVVNSAAGKDGKPLKARNIRNLATAAAPIAKPTATTTSTAANGNISGLPAKPAKATKDLFEESEDSGWDSNDDDAAENAAGKEPSPTSSKATTPVPLPAMKKSGSNSNMSGDAAETELEVDRRLMSWIRGKSIAQLLLTVDEVYTFGELPDLGSRWRGCTLQSVGGLEPTEIRKAYLRVVKVCHPDKHMHLDAKSFEFISVSRIFTVLSESYNKYKTLNGL